jgi:hypothetical protein
MELTPDQCVEEFKSDLANEGLNNYEAAHHSDLHEEEISKMSSDEALHFFLKMLELDERSDYWCCRCLENLFENKEKYGLNEEWFKPMLKVPELGF